jgi:ATP-binding cassette subfamily C protein
LSAGLVIRLVLARSSSTHPHIAAALRNCRRAFLGTALFSAAVNLLMLVGPLYMLQVYDRVLASRSVPTLVALSIFLVGAYAFQGLLDSIRSRIVVRAAALLDSNLDVVIHRTVVALAISNRGAGAAVQPVRDLDQIRTFMTGAGPIAIVDLPWVPFFVGICFLIHPWIGVASLACAIILLALTVQTERASRQVTAALNEENGKRTAMAEGDRRNSASIIAMGMGATLAKRWSEINQRYVGSVARSSDVVNSFGSASKVLRLLMQSVVLGLGAYLVIRQEMSAGAIIAASIMLGRALAPIETAISNWRSFVGARDSIKRLSVLLGRLPLDRDYTELPAPTKSLDVEQVFVTAPGSQSPILANVNFRLVGGEVCGIVGPNGSGKTSLSRVLVGIWPPARGKVRLDGAALDQWNPDARGRHVGYLSQSIELFQGTIAENIARMSAEPDSEAVLAAARAAGAHEMILRLPSGYDTAIGDLGEGLSLGQQQRIALARALYGDPFFVLLDEPSANLDGEGEMALHNAIKSSKERGAIVVLVAHRRSALAVCDKVLVLLNGTQQYFGTRDEVLRRLAGPPQAPAVANLKVVADTPAKE